MWEDVLLRFDPIYLVVGLIIAAAVIVFGIKFTLKNAEKFFDKIDGRLDKTDNKIDLLFVEQQSTDYALDKCLPSNGYGYMDHKKEKKTELLKDQEYVNRRD